MERPLPFGLSEAQLTESAFSQWGEICPNDELFSDRIKESAREKGVSNRGRNSNKTSAIIDSVLTPEFRKWLTLDNSILGTEEKLNSDLEWAIRNAVKIHDRLGERGEEKGQFGFNHLSWLEHPELRADYIRSVATSTATDFCHLANELKQMGMTDKQVGKIARGVFIEKPEDILEKAKSLENQFSELSGTKIGSAMLRSKLHPEAYLTKKYLNPKQVVAEPIIEQQAAAEETTNMSKFTKDEHQQLMSGFNQISEGIKTPEFADGLLQELRESKRQQEASDPIQVRIVGNGRTEKGRYFDDSSSQMPSMPPGPVIKENQYRWREPKQVFDEPFVPPYLRPSVENSARNSFLVGKYIPGGIITSSDIIYYAAQFKERADIELQKLQESRIRQSAAVHPINQLAIAGASSPDQTVIEPEVNIPVRIIGQYSTEGTYSGNPSRRSSQNPLQILLKEFTFLEDALKAAASKGVNFHVAVKADGSIENFSIIPPQTQSPDRQFTHIFVDQPV